VAAAVGLALGLGAVDALRSFQYNGLDHRGGRRGDVLPGDLPDLGAILTCATSGVVLVVIQTVMFGMGTQMSLRDFVGVMKMPWGVFVAVACQFLVMPLSGFVLIKLFPLPDEIAAGVILIGACSSGLGLERDVLPGPARIWPSPSRPPR
jgi:BASS family bile acid:Na+ symporter